MLSFVQETISSRLAYLQVTGLIPEILNKESSQSMKWYRCWFVLFILSISAFAGDSGPYGIQLGSVIGFGGAGLGYDSGRAGIHPGFGGGVEVGLHRYFGLFGDVDYLSRFNDAVYTCYQGCIYGSVKSNLVDAAGGLEVVGNNHSRFVPYAKIGMGYGRATGSAFGYSASAGAPAIAFGVGLHAYVRRHFGIEAQVLTLHYVGSNGGGTTAVSTFGVFLQSK